ncbi:glycoprotein [Amycolatopsis antarctica]|uniref:Glycoprotein n=1 Tax=Amycolatopsis antarctica TaxID=1854586 RepID=A0A263CXX8_9PSEU|nr:LytR C-terminal domain-containing protein [Amycolatopsis antarctica]OZM71002.1 glycoprotein [Amycolatopsis antarctica]
MNAFEGVSRPARAAGIALLGIAAVAAVVGGVTLVTTGDSEDTAAPPSSSAPDGPGGVPVPPGEPTPGPGGTATPSPTGQPTTPPSPGPGEPGGPTSAAPTPAPGEPGGPPGTQPGGEPGGDQGGVAGDQQASAKWVTVRVYNNSNIKGLAERAGQDLRGQGWNVAEFSNYSSGIIPTTTAYYRPGTDEETAAKALAASFGMRVEARFDGIRDSSEGVIVIVTNDYQAGGGKTGS